VLCLRAPCPSPAAHHWSSSVSTNTSISSKNTTAQQQGGAHTHPASRQHDTQLYLADTKTLPRDECQCSTGKPPQTRRHLRHASQCRPRRTAAHWLLAARLPLLLPRTSLNAAERGASSGLSACCACNAPAAATANQPAQQHQPMPPHTGGTPSTSYSPSATAAALRIHPTQERKHAMQLLLMSCCATPAAVPAGTGPLLLLAPHIASLAAWLLRGTTSKP
jgi:hypothetical protein